MRKRILKKMKLPVFLLAAALLLTACGGARPAVPETLPVIGADKYTAEKTSSPVFRTTEAETSETETTEPKTTEPETTEPETTEPKMTEPEMTETEPPEPAETELPETEPPATDSPWTEPPWTAPPETWTEPPWTAPPETEPPWTAPPETWTEPPWTAPPETWTAPPETDPPWTAPPETDPSETDPSETDPPETDPPETDPPETDPPGTEPVTWPPEAVRIWIGDSRMRGVQMYARPDPATDIFIVKDGEGLGWFTTVAVPQLENILAQTQPHAVMINMGFNDCYATCETGSETRAAVYGRVIDGLIAAYPNVHFYFCSVGLVVESEYTGQVDAVLINRQVERFNSGLRDACGAGYIDSGEYAARAGLTTFDGIHYDMDSCRALYRYITEKLEADGI